LLDKVAADLGEECYEVPVGFKYISSKIDEVDAVLGGESSGGLTVRGHIHGKDSVYAASLFVEMMSKTGKTPTELLKKIHKKYGSYVMVEENLRFFPEQKDEILNIVMTEKKLPRFTDKVVAVNYEDGCKVYFEDSSFVICRFSGTEPLLRIFAENSSKEKAVLNLSFSSNNKFKSKSNIDLKSKYVKQLVILTLPMLLNDAIWQINGIVDKSIASTIGAGYISAINYSHYIVDMFCSVFATSIVTVFFPNVVKLFNTKGIKLQLNIFISLVSNNKKIY
jgi:hypothetical protein